MIASEVKQMVRVLVILNLPLASLGAEENWPRFRGPLGSGAAEDDPRLPDTWSKTENVKWVTDVPGLGWSSPVVWGERVFLTAVHSDTEYETPRKGLYLGSGRPDPPKGVHHWMVYCFDLQSGELLWKHEAHRGQPVSPRHPKSTYASETPTTDGRGLYVLFGDVGLYAYGLDGQPRWSHKIEPKKTEADYGAAASPVVHDGQVVFVYDNEQQSYIAAFDSETGVQRWRTARDEISTWATPLVWQNDLRTEIVTSGYRRIRSYDLRGNLLWDFDGQMTRLAIPSPLAALGMVYVASGFAGPPRPVYAINPGASGDITPRNAEAEHPFIRWNQPKAGPYNPSPMVYRDHYYTLFDRGFFTCHDARTGEEVYGKQRFPRSGNFTSSPWAYNGMLFCLNENGDTFVLEAGPQFKVIRTNRLDEFCMACPAIAQGKLLLRTASKLYCIGK